MAVRRMTRLQFSFGEPSIPHRGERILIVEGNRATYQITPILPDDEIYSALVHPGDGPTLHGVEISDRGRDAIDAVSAWALDEHNASPEDVTRLGELIHMTVGEIAGKEEDSG